MKKKRSPRSWRSAFCRLGSKQNFFHICSVPVQEELVKQFLKKMMMVKVSAFQLIFFVRTTSLLHHVSRSLHTFHVHVVQGQSLHLPLCPLRPPPLKRFLNDKNCKIFFIKNSKNQSPIPSGCVAAWQGKLVSWMLCLPMSNFSWRSVFACFCACSVTSVVPACWASAA